jgi:hypothetical protein
VVSEVDTEAGGDAGTHVGLVGAAKRIESHAVSGGDVLDLLVA